MCVSMTWLNLVLSLGGCVVLASHPEFLECRPNQTYFQGVVLGWPKCSFEFFHKVLQENPKELFGQTNIFKT